MKFAMSVRSAAKKMTKKAECLRKQRLAGTAVGRRCRGRTLPFKAAILVLAAACLFWPRRIEAQAGALDTRFAPTVAVPDDTLRVVPQRDGKLIISGNFRIVDGALRPNLARLNPDGKLDPSFTAETSGGPIPQADGKVLLNNLGSSVVRLQPDGRLDAGLNLQAYLQTNGFYYGISTVVSQPDGKVILGGNFPGLNGQAHRYLARANPDGTLDATFNPDVGPDRGVDNSVYVAALQPDGKIVIGGSFSTVSGVFRYHLARLNSDGSLDTTFHPNIQGPNLPPSIILVLPDGKILIAGGFYSFDGVHRAGLARLNSDGTLDPTFDPGSGISGVVNDFIILDTVAVQPDGKVIVGGRFTGFSGTTGLSGIVRLNPDGSPDATFNTGSGATGGNYGGRIFSVVVQPDNKLVIAGGFDTFNGISRPGIARLNSDGSLDDEFNPDVEVASAVAPMAVQGNGKPIIAGRFSLVNGVSRSRIARLNLNGSLDTSFDAGTGPEGPAATVSTLAAQSDNTLLLGGNFVSFNGVPRQRIARLKADGNVDLSFNPAGATFSYVYALASQPNGGVLVGGSGFLNGTNHPGVIRLNPAGSLDTNFIHGPGTGGGSYVGSIALQTDEKILIAGRFRSFDGIGRTNLARLNPDGTLDTGFTASGIAPGTVTMIALQPDGKILTVITNFGLYRLNPDGSTDTNFTAAFRYINYQALSADGRIYVAGGTYDAQSDVLRLNGDGSLDSTFAPVRLGKYDRIYSMALEPNGLSLFLAGYFASVNGVLRTSLARVFTVQQPGLAGAEFDGANCRFLLSGEMGRAYRIDTSTNLLDWLTLGTVSLTNSTQAFADTNALGFERRYYRGVVVP